MRAAESESGRRRAAVAGRAARRNGPTLPAQAVRRLSAAPFSLFDAGFASAPRWLELRARGVHDLPQRGEARLFRAAAARSITRRMLVYGWHLARSRPRAACLVFGSTIAAVESLAACSLAALEAAAERNADALRPRWSNQTRFWRELLRRGVSRRRRAAARAAARRHSAPCGGNTRGACSLKIRTRGSRRNARAIDSHRTFAGGARHST